MTDTAFIKRIGNYIVTSHCLGSGSVATVHLAIDTAAQRQVACKSIKSKKESELGKVMKEYKIMLALDHVRINSSCKSVEPDTAFLIFQPNINKVFDVEVDGKFMFV
jgi:meiosis-specific serine/threonine-protein kinase MEK1